MNMNTETAMHYLESGSPASARLLLDEAGASTMEFLLVSSLAITLLTLFVLAFDTAWSIKSV